MVVVVVVVVVVAVAARARCLSHTNMLVVYKRNAVRVLVELLELRIDDTSDQGGWRHCVASGGRVLWRRLVLHELVELLLLLL